MDAAGSVRLVYVRDPTATACPDEGAFRRAIERRIGSDPFSAWGSAAIVVRVARRGPEYFATVERVEHGTSLGARALSSDASECLSVVDAAALAISIALEADRAPKPSTSADPASERDTARPTALGPATEPLAPAVPLDTAGGQAADRSAPPPPGDRAGRARGAIGLDGVISVATAPSVAAGATAWGAVRVRSFSFGAELSSDAPSSGGTALAGRVSTWLVAGTLAPCIHAWLFFGCALGEFGVLHGAGVGVRVPRSGLDAFAAVGPRLGIEVPLIGPLLVRIRGDMLLNLQRATVNLDGQPAWIASPVAAVFGAGIAWRIP